MRLWLSVWLLAILPTVLLGQTINGTGVIISLPAANSTFTQSGTGAVARTVDTKLKDGISIKDFGAVGDGVTDDTAALQAAWTACPTNGTIFAPPGTYVVTAKITIKSNCEFYGPGVFSYKVASDSYPIFYCTGCTGIRIHDTNFLGPDNGTYVAVTNSAFNESSVVGQVGILLVNSTDNWIERVTANGFGDTGIMLLRSSKNRLNSNSCKRNVKTGIAVWANVNGIASYNTITNNYLENNGIGSTQQARGLQLNRCYDVNCSFAGSTYGLGNGATHNICTENHARGNSFYGIEAYVGADFNNFTGSEVSYNIYAGIHTVGNQGNTLSVDSHHNGGNGAAYGSPADSGYGIRAAGTHQIVVGANVYANDAGGEGSPAIYVANEGGYANEGTTIAHNRVSTSTTVSGIVVGNALSTAGALARSSGTVTFTYATTFDVGQKIQIYGVTDDPSFNGIFTILTSNGTTTTWTQGGSDSSGKGANGMSDQVIGAHVDSNDLKGTASTLPLNLSANVLSTNNICDTGVNCAGAGWNKTTSPVAQKWQLVKIANSVNTCANVNGCWQVNGNYIAIAVAGLTQDITIITFPANGYLTRIRLKTGTACTVAGGTAKLDDIGSAFDSAWWFSLNTGYDIAAAPSNTNFKDISPTVFSSSSTAATTISVRIVTTVGNVDQIPTGCLIDFTTYGLTLP